MQMRRRDERGATMVILALSLVAMVALTGVALDGGAAFSNRRQTQNAADAAALAGAAKVNKKLEGVAITPTDVWNAVLAAAQSENNTDQQPTCKFVNPAGVPLGLDGTTTYPSPNEASAPECRTFSSIPSSAAGVRVIASDQESTNFMRVVGIGSFKTASLAKATVQRVEVPNQTGTPSPLMVCVDYSSSTGENALPSLLTGDRNTNPPQVNKAAIDQNYPLQYPNGNKPEFPRCQLGNNWKGLVAPFERVPPFPQYDIPGVWPGENGDRGINTAKAVYASRATDFPCGSDLNGCVIDVPLCWDNTGSGLYCVAMGRFKLTDSGRSSEINGYFKGFAPIVVPGGTGGLPPGEGGARVVKLIE